MIRRILLPLDNSSYTEAALAYAAKIARRDDAEVSGMVVLDIPGIIDSVGPYVPGGVDLAEMYEETEIEKAQEHIDKILKAFKSTLGRSHIKHREFEYQGSPGSNIIKESFFYDLLVIGLRTFFHFETSDKPGDSLEKILDHTITPILAVPDHFKEIKKVLIVCDATPASARAMQRFSHIAEGANYEITLLVHNKKQEEAEFYLNRAEEYLSAYGTTKIHPEWTSHSLTKVIEEKYIDETDLIVVGMHQHKSLKEFVVGDLVTYLIKENSKPLFIVQ